MWRRLFPTLAKVEPEKLLVLPLIVFMAFSLLYGVAEWIAVSLIVRYSG
jgi:hypothetical protein